MNNELRANRKSGRWEQRPRRAWAPRGTRAGAWEGEMDMFVQGPAGQWGSQLCPGQSRTGVAWSECQGTSEIRRGGGGSQSLSLSSFLFLGLNCAVGPGPSTLPDLTSRPLSTDPSVRTVTTRLTPCSSPHLVPDFRTPPPKAPQCNAYLPGALPGHGGLSAHLRVSQGQRQGLQALHPASALTSAWNPT